jgi:DNA-binding CsgD family transcriptional regulator
MNIATEVPGTQLTHREREVLYCIAAGMSPEQIADRLFTSENIVTSLQKKMLEKMGAKNFADLIRINIKSFARQV